MLYQIPIQRRQVPRAGRAIVNPLRGPTNPCISRQLHRNQLGIGDSSATSSFQNLARIHNHVDTYC